METIESKKSFLIAFNFYSAKYRLKRSYRFEVAAITINWLVIVIIGILAGTLFKRELKIEKFNL